MGQVCNAYGGYSGGRKGKNGWANIFNCDRGGSSDVITFGNNLILDPFVGVFKRYNSEIRSGAANGNEKKSIQTSGVNRRYNSARYSGYVITMKVMDQVFHYYPHMSL